MPTHILNNIKRYVPLTAADEAGFMGIVRERKLRKRQFIVQPEFVCTHQTYVSSGALRAYFVVL